MAPWVADEKTANLQGLLFSFFKTFLLLFPAYLDRTAILQYDNARNQNHPKYYFLSFDEIHISQAVACTDEHAALCFGERVAAALVGGYAGCNTGQQRQAFVRSSKIRQHVGSVGFAVRL